MEINGFQKDVNVPPGSSNRPRVVPRGICPDPTDPPPTPPGPPPGRFRVDICRGVRSNADGSERVGGFCVLTGRPAAHYYF